MKLKGQEIDRICSNPPEDLAGVLLYGENSGLVAERGKKAQHAILGGEDDPFRLMILTGEQLKPGDLHLMDEMKAVSMMGGRRVVRIRGAKNAHAEMIQPALDEFMTGDAFLIVETGSQGPRDALRKLFEAQKNAAAAPCYDDDARSLEDLARQVLSQHGCNLTSNAAAVLIPRLGTDRALALQELEKLSLYAGGGQIDEAMVEAIVGDGGEFDYTDVAHAVFLGDQKHIETGVEKIFAAKGNPVSLLNGILRHAHRLHLAISLMAQGNSADQALTALRPPVFFKDKTRFQNQLRRWSPENMAKALQLLIEAERRCKTTGYPAETICRRVLMQVAAAAR